MIAYRVESRSSRLAPPGGRGICNWASVLTFSLTSGFLRDAEDDCFVTRNGPQGQYINGTLNHVKKHTIECNPSRSQRRLTSSHSSFRIKGSPQVGTDTTRYHRANKKLRRADPAEPRFDQCAMNISGQLPSLRVRSAIRTPRAAVDAWINNNTVGV